MKHITDIDSGKIIALVGERKSYRAISKDIAIPKSTVGDCMKKLATKGTTARKPSSGGVIKVTNIDLQTIRKLHAAKLE